MRRKLSLLCAVLLLPLVAGQAAAQDPEAAPPASPPAAPEPEAPEPQEVPDPTRFSGQTVLRVEFLAPAGTDIGDLGYLVDVEPGAAYEPGAVRRTLELLYRLGQFEEVQARVRPEQGGVVLTFVLEPSPRIRRIDLSGVSGVLPTRLRAALGRGAGEPLTSGDELRMRDAALAFYVSRGFFDAQVEVDVQPHPRGGVVVAIEAGEGSPYRVREVALPGPELAGYPESMLRELLGLRLRPGTIYREEDAIAAVQGLLEGLRKRGFVEARLLSFAGGSGRIAPFEVRLDRATKSVDITLPLDAGRLVEADFEFDRPVRARWTRGRLERAVGLSTAQRVSAGYAEDAARRLQQFLRGQGYYHAEVRGEVEDVPFERPRGVPEARLPRVEQVRRLRFTVASGPLVLVKEADISVAGNRFLSRKRKGPLDKDGVIEVLSDASPDAIGRRPPPAVVLGWRLYRRYFTEDEMESAATTLQDYYRARGFLKASVKWSAEVPPDGEEPGRRVLIELSIEEGPRTVVESLVLETPFPLGEAFEAAMRKGIQGEPFNPDAPAELAGRVRAALAERGFIDATVSSRREFSTDESLVRLTLIAEPGPRVRFGQALVRGNRHTQVGLIRRELRMKAGETFSYTSVDSAEQRLLRTGLFDSVSIEPAQATGRVRDITVRVKDRKRFSFVLAGGVIGPDEGPRVRAEARLRNLDGRGLAVFARARVGIDWTDLFLNAQLCPAGPEFCIPPDYRISLGLELPALPGLPLRATLSGVINEEINDSIYRIRRSSVAFSAAYRGAGPVRLDLRAEIQGRVPLVVDPVARLHPTADQPSVQLLVAPDGTVVREALSDLTAAVPLALLGASAALDLRDDPFNPTKGIYVAATAETTPGKIAARAPAFGRLVGQVVGFVPLGGAGVGLRLEGQGGYAWSYEDELPPVEYRFRLGGTGSVRGFGLHELGPGGTRAGLLELDGLLSEGVEDRSIPVGGDAFYRYTVELLLPLPGLEGWRLAVFHDGGNAWITREVPDYIDPATTTMWRGTAGIGLRRQTAIGPLRLDLAFRPANFPIADQVRLGEVVQVHFAVGSL